MKTVSFFTKDKQYSLEVTDEEAENVPGLLKDCAGTPVFIRTHGAKGELLCLWCPSIEAVTVHPKEDEN
jgi:hypothetical protein